MKKVLDQTVRDLKREVNKKVLKVPTIEQKTLDATSNEPWGPHGTKLADIAQATRNYHEYQMIMNIIWKRINDTGKNWRHVYKALTVLEYLVAHGSERVIDDIKEHAYQISTLSDFQYIDSSGRDQGSNVRRKSQSLVSLVNDKERIAEVREKAHANKDKFRSSFSTGKLDSYSSSGGYGDRYDDDRYESRYRDEDRYGNRREKESSYRDDDRYNRGGDSYGREGDRYGRDADDRYGGDSYKDDESRGRRDNDDGQYGTRNRSRDRDRSVDDDDDRHSSRSGGARVDEASKDERFEQRFSEPSIDGPPSYEEVIKETAVQAKEENVRNGGDVAAAATKESSPCVPKESPPLVSSSQGFGQVVAGPPVPAVSNETDGFDEFDPRGAAPRAAVPSNAESSLGMDLFGSASASDSIYSLALMPIAPVTADTGSDVTANFGFANGFADPSSLSSGMNQPGENPFGDTPFQAIPESTAQESYAPATSFQSFASNNDAQTHSSLPSKMETTTSFDFGDSFGGISFTPVSNSQQSDFANSSASLPEVPTTDTNNDISDLLGPQAGSAGFIPPQAAQPAAPAYVQGSFHPQQTTVANPAGFPPEIPGLQTGNGGFGGLAPPQTASYASLHTAQPTTVGQMPVYPQSGMATPIVSQSANQFAPHNARPMATLSTQNMQYNVLAQSRPSAPFSMESPAPDFAIPPAKQPSKDKFETKSTVWADTLSRGLVNLNISGPKINPHADIGVDFDSINRREKRKEEKKSSAAPVVSTVTMGKAMGSGSGIGRAGASSLGTPPNPLMNSGMGLGVGMGMGVNAGMGMNAYGMSMNRPTGMGMNMGMGQGMQMRPPIGGMAPPNTVMPGVGYNTMPGMGAYNPHQQQYGGGYR